jgi:hypothetical protein
MPSHFLFASKSVLLHHVLTQLLRCCSFTLIRPFLNCANSAFILWVSLQHTCLCIRFFFIVLYLVHIHVPLLSKSGPHVDEECPARSFYSRSTQSLDGAVERIGNVIEVQEITLE